MTSISREKAQQIVDHYEKHGFGPGGEGVTSYCYAKRVLQGKRKAKTGKAPVTPMSIHQPFIMC